MSGLLGNKKEALFLALILSFWAAMVVGIVMYFTENEQSGTAVGIGIGMVGILMTILGMSVIGERKITADFSDDNRGREETYVGKDAVLLGLFYVLIGIGFLCLSGYILYLQLNSR